MTTVESDDDYRLRLVDLPGVGVFTAEDLGNIYGEHLDLYGELFDCPRHQESK